MKTPKLNGQHGEMITQMYSKIGILINDVSNIKDSHKELKKDISVIQESITDLKVNTKGYSENLNSVKCELDEHKKEHNRIVGRIIAIFGIIATFISITVSFVIELFKK
jgi:uncharacterized coiled-coil DUF342 family protein